MSILAEYDDSCCKYHPTEAGRWRCEKCAIYFCSDCIPYDKEDVYPRCVLCRRDLKSLSVSKELTPFWNKLSYFFLSPFNLRSLVFISFFGLTLALIPSGKIGLAISVVVLIPITNFLFTLMEDIANRETPTTEIKSIFQFNNTYLFVRLIFGCSALLVLFIKAGAFLDQNLMNVIAAFFLFGVPASWVILMMEKRFLSLINPQKILYIIRLFGKAYILLYLILVSGLLLYVSLTVGFSNSTTASVNNFGSLFLSNSLMMYLLVVFFSMMGYLVLQYHYELNYRVRLGPVKPDLSGKHSSQANVEIFIQEGRFEDAQKILLEKIAGNEMDVAANERLVLLYAFQGKNNDAKKIAKRYFELLVQSNKQKQAADFYYKLRTQKIPVSRPDPQTALTMIKEMHNKNQHLAALELIDLYSCRPGQEERWDEFAFEKSIILREFQNKRQQAAELLTLIVKRSLNQERLESAQFRLDTLD